MYVYILLNQDGTKEELAQVSEEVELSQLREWLNCRTVELVHSNYYQKEWGNCIVWGDEEGRFNSENYTNPHAKVLGPGWDCVGNLVLVQEV